MTTVFLASIFMLVSVSAQGFRVCKDHLAQGYGLVLQSFDVQPAVPITGGNIEFDLSGSTEKEIVNGAIVKVSLEALGIEVSSHEFNICDLSGIVCPIPAGDHFQGSIYYKLPEQVPEGVELLVTVEFLKGNEIIACVERDIVAVESLAQALGTRFGFDPLEISFLFKKWIAQHGFNITADLLKRKVVFAENLVKIALHNAGEQSWKMAMNQFGHLTHEEFKKTYASGLMREKPRLGLRSKWTARSLYSISKDDLPETVNWVKAGAVTPVKNQGACGSCWAFATTGALEGAYFIKYGSLVSFSEQHLVSCDNSDKGCNGGFMDTAYQWIQENGGLCSEEDYPYTSGTGMRGWCRHRCTPVEHSIPSGFFDVEHEEISLQSAVAKQPVAIAIEADQTAFQFYSKGVLTAECGTNLDHGVLLVGYGTEDGQDYWLVKNSWGPAWGDDGYIKIGRGNSQEGGECGVLLAASYPMF